MVDFNPDAYLATKTGGFNPDAYLESKQPKKELAETDPYEFEKSDQYPTAAMTDPSINDYLTVTGAVGLAKGVAGLGLGAAKNLLAKTVVPTLEKSAANQALRSLGASVGQVRQLGVEEARQAGKYALDKGLVDIFSSEVGREAKLKTLSEATGKSIGELREMAGMAPTGIKEKIVTELTPKYQAGVYSGEKAGLEKALQEIPTGPVSHADLARQATKLNKYAAENRLVQPTSAATDVANAIGRENNEGIVQALGSDKGKQYLESLAEMSKQKPVEAFMARGEAKEAAGLGSNTAFGSITGGLKRIGGHRVGAKIADIGAGATSALARVLPSGEGAAIAVPAAKTVAGITSSIMNKLQTNPQSLGKFAKPLMQAAQTGGSKGIAATHYVLSSQYPEYNEAMLSTEKKNDDENEYPQGSPE